MKFEPTHPEVENGSVTPTPLLPQVSVTCVTAQHSDECRACGEPLDPELLAADGVYYHPSCGAA